MIEDCHNDFHVAVKLYGLKVEDHGPLSIGQIVRRYRSSPDYSSRQARIDRRRHKKKDRKPKPFKPKKPSISGQPWHCRRACKQARKAKYCRESIVQLVSDLTAILSIWPDPEAVNLIDILSVDADEPKSVEL